MPTIQAATVLTDVARSIREPVHLVAGEDGGIDAVFGDCADRRVLGALPPLYPEWLGDRSFG